MRAALAALRPPVPRHPLPNQDADRPKARNALGTFARYPALAQAFHTFNGHVLFASTLSTRQRELIVLRVASLRQCEYEWRQHAVLAGDVGIASDEVERVADGATAGGWSSLEAALLNAVDELITEAKVSDDTWAALAHDFDDRQLMDLVFTVGAYDALAMAFLSFGVQLDDDLMRK
jgi:AhpD family alkylhydroperoxidase